MRRQWILKAAAAVAVLFGGFAHANVMEQVPSEALVVVRINNLEQTSGRIGALADRLQLAQFSPDLADPLGAARRDMGLNQGLRTDGQAALVILPDEMVAGFDEPFILLIPVTDYDQFLQNFEQREGEGEIRQVNVPEWDEPGYVARRGDYAALARSRRLLEVEQRGITLPQISAREADAANLAIIVNVPAVRDRALPTLEMGRAMALAQLEAQAGQDPQAARFLPLIRSVVNQVMDGFETGLRNAEGLVITFRLDDAGINSTFLTEFQQDSPFGRAVASIRNTDEDLLSGLPEGRYLLYGGSVQDPQATAALFDQVLGPVRQQVEALGDDARPAVQYLEAMRSAVAAQSSQTFGMIAPAGALLQESLFQMVSIARGDAEAMRTATQRLFESQQELMRALADDDDQATTIFTANAVTIDGVALDRFETRLEFDPQTPQGAQAQQAITMLYGPDGINGYVGKIDDQTLITLMGPRQQALQRYIAAARADEAPMTDRVAAVAGQLPQERAVVMYFPLDVLVTTVANYARAFGVPVQLQIPPDLPPIGMTIASESGAVRFDAHVPTRLVESLTAAGMQVWMQMMGGDMFQADPGDF